MQINSMTYNILDGGVGREELLLRVLEQTRPDIVILQEVMGPELLQRFGERLGLTPYLALGTSQRHMGLLSRYPIVAATSHHPFPPIRTTVLEATVEVAPGQRLALVGVHLVPHFAWPLELWRLWEISVALRRARSYRGLPCLLAGDFNAIAPGDAVVRATLPPRLNWMIRLQGGRVLRSVVRRTQAEGFVDCFRRSNPADAGFTVPAGRPNTRLDYLFANAQLADRLVSCNVVRELEEAGRASDHYPVLARFAFDDQRR